MNSSDLKPFFGAKDEIMSRTSMDEEVKHWNMIVHGYGSEVRIQDDAASEDFRTLKPP
jgi:hypothetical protein